MAAGFPGQGRSPRVAVLRHRAHCSWDTAGQHMSRERISMEEASSQAMLGDAWNLIAEDDEFDPLEVDDMDINQEDMDDDNPYDTVDYPTMRNMPPEMQRDAVFTPARQGGARNATVAMIKRNPACRPVLLMIIGLCEGGCASSELSSQVKQWQEDNHLVYAPMTLCRMLERAGALELELPETSEEHENVEEGVAYLEINEQVDPIWHATEAGLAVREELTRGDSFRKIVLDEDVRYLEVYETIMDKASEAPLTRQQICDVVDTFEIVKKPRRFGEHFIDMLELSDVLAWHDHAWCLTDLGRRMIPEVKAARGV